MANLSSKRVKSIVAIYIIALAFYVLAFVVIPFPKSATAWIAFGFTVLSIIASLIICRFAFNCTDTVGAIYGFPIFKIGLVYMICQTIVGVVLCVIASFVAIPYWISLLLSAFMFGFAVVGVILAGNARDVVVEVEETTAESVKKLAIFNLDIAEIIDICRDEELKLQLQKLGDSFKYSSDPVSSDATKEIEQQISNELDVLKGLVGKSDDDKIHQQIRLVHNLLMNRNRICQANK